MKGFVEKLLNELNYQKEYNQIVYDAKPRTEHEKDLNAVLKSTYDSAIRIAKRLAREYSVGEENAHTGWIPCSEKLPNKDMWCLATFENGNVDKIQYLASQKWWNGEMGDNRVIAWQPLPAPYQPKGE